ncbi:hypothetical protein BCR36DRAFT_183345 [Piromyces finnis]|uniref:Uncharacterized protein n=1 Tax=Piromyces finnis TaxID=1754191 RepID=A0A1Y1VGS3_9FUNG|nr:hypothetical protein BCR36DRAFT_183345 [Piromyces finnis]|eukprot:ORX55283.1 hypothetical protein BCR36DRAFT_183345 [Piromyces finnis]
MMKGMNNLNNLNLSNNIQLKMSVINFKESGYIENCNFENTKIACYEKNTCANIVPELNNYKECSSELINKLRPNNKNRILTIFSIVSVILLCIVGFIWMYKVNKKSKKSREADIIISPTVKNENYYKDSLSNKKNAEENKTNQSFNVGNDTQTIIDNSFTSHKEAVSSLTSNSISNIQRNLSNNSNGSFIINNAVQSPILVGNDPSLVHPLRNLTLQASNNNNGNQMISSSTTPMASSSTINNQTIATSMEMQSPFTNSGFNNNITSINVTNPMFKGNETNILQIPSSTYINPNMPNNIMNGQTLINLYPINMLNYSMNNSYLAGSSSSDNIIPTTDGKDIKEFDDKLKKKILKEKMNLEKFSINQNNNQNDPNNNLPPYSEL